MEKVLDYISKLLPLIAFYPRWAQGIFLVTFLFMLSSFATFVIFYSSASTQKNEADALTLEGKLTPDLERDIGKDLKEVDGIFAELGSALSAYYASAVSLRLDLLDYTEKNPDIASYTDKTLPADLRRDVEVTIKKLDGIRSALAAIQRNQFAMNCWSRAARGSGSALANVRDALIKHGFTEQEATIKIADISGLQQFIELASRRLGDFTFGPILTAVLATNSSSIPGVNKTYDHAALRTFIFSGNIIFNFINPSKSAPGTTLVVSWGSAILFDMLGCIPSSELVREELKERYRGQAQAISKMYIAMTASQSIISDVSVSANELKNRFGLLVLELPPKK